jgi:phage gpG-like protein
VSRSSRAVLGQLRTDTLSATLVPSLRFTPSIGIAAGRIDKLGLDIRSFREPLGRAIRQVMVPSIRRNFDEGGRPAWEPLASSTLAFREFYGAGGQAPLVRTGQLRRVASQINIWDVSTTTAVIRDLPQRVWYGKIQQSGYDGGSMKALVKKHGGDLGAADAEHSARLEAALAGGDAAGGRTAASIPARPFIMFQPEDEDAIAEVFIKWLDERIIASKRTVI